MPGYVDLHVHTSYSDGSFTPAEVVRRAVNLGLSAIAITDHDGVDGNAEAFAEGAQNGLEVITGVEIIDPTEERLATTLEEVREYRRVRNPKVLEKLAELGMPIALEEVAAKAKGRTVGRPHIAEVMVEKGYVSDFQEAFEKYLAHNKPAYVHRRRVTAEEGINLIHGAGGLAFLAHPGVYALPARIMENMIYKLTRAGLDGVEVYYSDHLPTDTAFLNRIVEEYDLLATGGTDFHGDAKPGIEVGVGRGDLKVPYELVARMKARLGARARRAAMKR
jgi:predicted metal-dependent phosphoesterase TrpH